MIENHVMTKACEICNSEYLIDSKYCPACGSKNDEYPRSNQINEIKNDIKNSKYYNKLSVEEISYLDENPYENYIREKICPNCGWKNALDSQFCEECGTKLAWVEFETSIMNICPKCGCKNTSDSQFCEECGTKLTWAEFETSIMNICQHCGAIAHDGDKFCSECGQKL